MRKCLFLRKGRLHGEIRIIVFALMLEVVLAALVKIRLYFATPLG